MLQGYVKLWRVSLEKPIFHNPHLWQFATWCLMKASHKHKKQMVGFKEVFLEPGQFVFGRNAAAIELRSTPQRIRTCVTTLRNIDFLTIKSTNKYSIITVNNWHIYQQDDQCINQQNNHQLTSNQPATNHKQECKECKEDTDLKISRDSDESLKADNCPQKEILRLYSETLPELPQPRVWNGTRAANLRARWNSGVASRRGTPANTIEFWGGLFKYIRKNDFLMGRTNHNGRKPFKCSLDWIVKCENFLKIVEGKYD